MNNKVLIIVIVILIVIGGLLVLSGKLVGKNTVQTNNSQKQTQQSTINSGEPAKGKPITEKIETVNITSSGFNPQEITIKKDVKVIWINRSGENVDIIPVNNSYAPLTLGEFPNDSSVQLSFDKVGKYSYQNKLKPSQTGTVVVE